LVINKVKGFGKWAAHPRPIFPGVPPGFLVGFGFIYFQGKYLYVPAVASPAVEFETAGMIRPD